MHRHCVYWWGNICLSQHIGAICHSVIILDMAMNKFALFEGLLLKKIVWSEFSLIWKIGWEIIFDPFCGRRIGQNKLQGLGNDGSWKNMFIVFLCVPGMESLVIFQEHLWIIDRRPIWTKYTNTQIRIYKYANTKIQRAWNHWWFFLGICELLIPRPILSSFRCQVSPDGVYFLFGKKKTRIKK